MTRTHATPIQQFKKGVSTTRKLIWMLAVAYVAGKQQPAILDWKPRARMIIGGVQTAEEPLRP